MMHDIGWRARREMKAFEELEVARERVARAAVFIMIGFAVAVVVMVL